MNKIQKIILSIYVIAGFGLWLFVVIHDGTNNRGCENASAIFQSCAIQYLIFLPVLFYFVLGIPTFILYKLWGNKNKNG